MTVCIAGVAESDKLVMVMDQMLTVEAVGGDLPNLAKGRRIHRRWFVMSAGNDMQHVPPILRRAGALLSDKDKPTVSEAVRAVEKAYVEHRLKIAQQCVLKPLNLDMRTLVQMLSSGDSETLREITDNLNALQFSVHLLAVGFDEYDNPHIFSILPPGQEGHYDDIGFWSVGSGSESAINNLFLRQYADSLSLPEAIYLLAESKFVAERQWGVGEKTAIVVMKSDDSMAVVTRTKAETVRNIWLKEARPPIPPKLDKRIGKLLVFRKPPPMPLPSASEPEFSGHEFSTEANSESDT